MDSKRKFIRNQQWKKKYKPRNSVKFKIKKKFEDEINSEEESGKEITLQQPIPTSGWFPDYDSVSSSESEQFEDNSCKNDKNWFDKELDNIEVSPNLFIEQKTNAQDCCKNKLSHNDSKKSTSGYSMKSKKLSNEEKVQKESPDDNDEELDFLLSLKEPVYSGPIIVKKTTHNDRRLTDVKPTSINHKPVKTIDLEKWLDTVLDE